MRDRHSDNAKLRDLIQRGDPAAGEEIAPADVARMRARLAAGASPGTDGVAWIGRLSWAAVAALLVVAVVLRFGPVPAPPPAAPTVSAGPPAVAAAAGTDNRQVQFVTREGTRIVWVLSSDLKL